MPLPPPVTDATARLAYARAAALADGRWRCAARAGRR